MNRMLSVCFAAVLLSACASGLSSSGWQKVRPNAEMLVIKELDGYGMGLDYSGKNIGLADSVVASFNSIGPTQRQASPSSMQGPIIRLRGATITPLDAATNGQVAKALRINAEPSMVGAPLWQMIKNKYPSMTHVAMTIYNIAEEWRISGDSSRIPYLWSSYVISRTLVVDLNTRQTVSEWRQEVQDRSTWTRAPEAPERLVFYLRPIETMPMNRK